MKEMGGAGTKYEQVVGAIPAEQKQEEPPRGGSSSSKEQEEQAPIPNHLLPYHLQVCRFFFLLLWIPTMYEVTHNKDN
jgi:hypothetical protein